jgi:hypothetical protein
MVRQTRSQTMKSTNVTPAVLAWSAHGEGQEITMWFTGMTIFFVNEGASDVFTEEEIATLTLNAVQGLSTAWYAHTQKQQNKIQALEVGVKVFVKKLSELLMSMPLERRNPAADFIEADGHFKFEERQAPVDQMD